MSAAFFFYLDCLLQGHLPLLPQEHKLDSQCGEFLSVCVFVCVVERERELEHLGKMCQMGGSMGHSWH